MRHAVYGRKLSRDINARKALLANLASDLLEKGELTTTLAKAKFARPYVEKVITAGKLNRLFRNRRLASVLTPSAFARLNTEVVPGFKNRPGGYTRIIKLQLRRGDNAQMAKIQLVAMEKVVAKTTSAPAANKVANKKAKVTKKPISQKTDKKESKKAKK